MIQINKISIIIPVYNAEKTIKRCLESILVSTYKYYEIILINDGSTDGSAEIITEYAKKYNHIKLITQVNSGPSKARNKGIEISEGDIISFVDSDDYVRKDYLEQIAKAFEKEEIDVVFFEFYRVTSNGVFISAHELPKLESIYYKNIIALSERDMFGYTWIKAFKREISFEVYFEENISLFEDEIFTCKLLKNPVKLYYLHETIYFYVCTDGSLVHKTHPEYCRLCDKVYHAWEEILNKTSEGENFLIQKANHMAQVCKYYGLERKINPFTFYAEMASSDFIQNITICDAFVVAIRDGEWCKVVWIYLKYNIKVFLARHVARKVKR